MGGFKGFSHTITYSTMHFKQFQADLVEKIGIGKFSDWGHHRFFL